MLFFFMKSLFAVLIIIMYVVYSSYHLHCICMYIANNYVDIDECTIGVHNCTQDQRCVNTPGDYYCVCFSGYEMIGGICEGND